MRELQLAIPVRRGDHDGSVKRVQEWLSLNGHGVQVDSDFGPATEAAVKKFQAANGLTADGVVDDDTFSRLVVPMRAALQPIAPAGRSLGAMVEAYARQHLTQLPREVGGENRGPWVRLYMDGHDGAEWRWCAGFVCFCLQQACTSLGVGLPLRPSFSCDSLAGSASREGLLVDGDVSDIATRVTRGSFFLVRRSAGDWRHVGIVALPEAQAYRTIEGNSNDDGSSNGHEVVARMRGYVNRDFIRIA